MVKYLELRKKKMNASWETDSVLGRSVLKSPVAEHADYLKNRVYKLITVTIMFKYNANSKKCQQDRRNADVMR